VLAILDEGDAADDDEKSEGQDGEAGIGGGRIDHAEGDGGDSEACGQGHEPPACGSYDEQAKDGEGDEQDCEVDHRGPPIGSGKLFARARVALVRFTQAVQAPLDTPAEAMLFSVDCYKPPIGKIRSSDKVTAAS
jgi:hypothetical protein